MSNHIFISYSSANKTLAKAVCEGLEKKGLKCWMAPRDISIGEEYAEAIIEAIESACLLLLILTKESNASQQVRREVERAAGKNVPIFPLKTDEVELSKSLEYFISYCQFMDATDGPIESHLERLAARIMESPERQLSDNVSKITAGQKVLPLQAIKRKKTKWMMGGIAVLICLAVAVFAWFSNHDRISDSNRVDEGFILLQQGRAEAAEVIFNTLKDNEGVYYLGIAALHLKREELDQASQALEMAKKKIPADHYIPIVEANIALRQGAFDKAENILRPLAENDKIKNWQKAEVFLGLGLILEQHDHFDNALEYYNNSLSLSPKLAGAHTAKAVILEQQGHLDQALAEYKEAMNQNDQDQISRVLYEKIQQKLKVEQDAARKERVDKLVTELAEAFVRQDQNKAVSDSWSSRPLYFFCLDLINKGQPASTPGENEYIVEQLFRGLSSAPRLHAVERELLDELLQELKLSGSSLTSPETALRLGHILSAQVLVTGNILRYQGSIQLTMRAIDVETTKIIGVVSNRADNCRGLPQLIDSTASALIGEIDKAYPIRARISELGHDGVRLNVGRLVGVSPGMVLALAEPEVNKMTLEITAVEDNSCLARPSDEQVTLQMGWRTRLDRR